MKGAVQHSAVTEVNVDDGYRSNRFPNRFKVLVDEIGNVIIGEPCCSPMMTFPISSTRTLNRFGNRFDLYPSSTLTSVTALCCTAPFMGTSRLTYARQRVKSSTFCRAFTNHKFTC